MDSGGPLQHAPGPPVFSFPSQLDVAARPPLILVDGSNAAFGGDGRPRLSRIRAILAELDKLELRSITIVDASLRHRIDEPDALVEMIRAQRILQAPAGRRADDFLLQLGRKRQRDGDRVFILTNDRFPETEGLAVPRIAFLLVQVDDSQLILFSPSLDSILPISSVADDQVK